MLTAVAFFPLFFSLSAVNVFTEYATKDKISASELKDSFDHSSNGTAEARNEISNGKCLHIVFFVLILDVLCHNKH